MVALGVVVSCTRVERRRALTVPRAIVLGKLLPTLISLRRPANGFIKLPPCRSRLANIDFKVANRRRTVRGFAPFMPANQFWTKPRSIDDTETSSEDGDMKVRKCSRSCLYALSVCVLSFRWSAQCARNQLIAE